MPALLRSAFVVALSLTCTWVLASGCSGAETQDVLSGASSASASSSGASSGSAGSSGASSGTSGTSGSSSGTSSGGGTTCVQEEEPNDQERLANVLSPARCGTLSRRDQKDFLTFRLKESTKTMSINFTGRIRLRVDVDGRDTTELTPDNAGIVPFVMGADYVIEVTPLTDSSDDLNWRVEVVES